MRARSLLLGGVGLLAGAAPAPLLATTPAPTTGPVCEAGVCRVRLTGDQLVAGAEAAIARRAFADAAPLVAALARAPAYKLQHRFLAGYVAVETGDFDTAIRHFRAILAGDPAQTRVRLELARALMLRGHEAAADHHFRLAETDGELPPELARAVGGFRGLLRSQRRWSFNLDVGLAPDTNINNATANDTVDVRFGPSTLPLTLDAGAKKRSGLGQTAGLSGGLRFKLGDDVALLADGTLGLTNYGGKRFDDLSSELAVGPELRLGERGTLSLQALAAQRWYGGQAATRQYGLRGSVRRVLGPAQRVSLQLDARHSDSLLAQAYSGWQFGAFATYERAVAPAVIASATAYARREDLQSAAYSNTDLGFDLGVGGELPWGLNAGLSTGASHARYDAPLALFSDDPRADWRLNARAHLGLRSVRVLGFSPSVTYTYGRTETNYDLYRTDRHRLRFNLARYF